MVRISTMRRTLPAGRPSNSMKHFSCWKADRGSNVTMALSNVNDVPHGIRLPQFRSMTAQQILGTGCAGPVVPRDLFDVQRPRPCEIHLAYIDLRRAGCDARG
jgi:hypothetical protein